MDFGPGAGSRHFPAPSRALPPCPAPEALSLAAAPLQGPPQCFCPPLPSLFAPQIMPGPLWSLDFGWVRFWGCQREHEEAAWQRRGRFHCCPDGNAVGKKSNKPSDCVLGGENPSKNTKKRGKRAQGLLFRASLAKKEEPWGCYGAHPGGDPVPFGAPRAQPACYPMDKPLVGGGFP